MGKPSKRERKFKATGGVKRRLEKGTITNKGKLRKRNKHSSDTSRPSKPAPQPAPKLERKNDFLGQENLRDLDIDTFFAKSAEAADIYGDDEEDGSGDKEEIEEEDKVEEQDEDASEEATEDEVEQAKIERDQNSFEESRSSSEDSDDDDLDAAEARMQAEMRKMQKDDPEFHEFLKENEESLLEFGQDQDNDDNEDGDDEVQVTDKDSQRPSAVQTHLTKNVLTALEKGTFNSHGIKNLKKLIAAYKSACHLADEPSATRGERRPGESGSLYLIDSSKVFDELMVMCLHRCHEEFHYHLLGKSSNELDDSKDLKTDDDDDDKLDDAKPLNPKTLENADRWEDVRPILHSFFRSTLHVMSEAKEPQLLTFILRALSKYLRFLTPFPRIAESMLKSLTSLWSAPLDTSENYQLVRLNAFFRIRQLALTQPFPFIENILKKTYLAYARRSKFGTAASVTSVLPTLTFMGNCLVEVYSLDYHSSYQHSFVYIRQLALLLRAAMQKKTPEAMQQVYCWQYLHCLKLWVAVLSAAAPEDDATSMRSLIYPLTEIILGTARFVPSPMRHMPLRFHCVRLLQQLAASTEVFIPTTSLLLDCLDWKEWYMAPKMTKTGSARALQIQYILKLPKEDTLRTHEQLETGINEFFLLLNREVELYRYSAGFPEFSVRIIQRLRLFAKEVRNSRWRTFAKACMETCERYAASAVLGRSKLQQAPKDVTQLECLRSVSEKTMRERHEESIQKEQKALDAARPAPTGKTKTQKKGVAAKDNDEDVVHERTTNKAMKSKNTSFTKKQKKTEGVKGAATADKSMLEEEDSVQEGVDWSDEE